MLDFCNPGVYASSARLFSHYFSAPILASYEWGADDSVVNKGNSSAIKLCVLTNPFLFRRANGKKRNLSLEPAVFNLTVRKERLCLDRETREHSERAAKRNAESVPGSALERPASKRATTTAPSAHVRQGESTVIVHGVAGAGGTAGASLAADTGGASGAAGAGGVSGSGGAGPARSAAGVGIAGAARLAAGALAAQGGGAVADHRDLEQEEESAAQVYNLPLGWLQGYRETIAREEVWCEGEGARQQLLKMQGQRAGAKRCVCLVLTDCVLSPPRSRALHCASMSTAAVLRLRFVWSSPCFASDQSARSCVQLSLRHQVAEWAGPARLCAQPVHWPTARDSLAARHNSSVCPPRLGQ